MLHEWCPENVLEKIEQTVQDPETNVVFLVGAGASLESGVPTVNWFFSELLKKMGLPEEVAQWLRQSRIPFEFVMELIKKRFGEKMYQLCKVFTGNVPNDIHRYIMTAFLQYENVSVLSSNFDPLLEKSVRKKLSSLVSLKKIFRKYHGDLKKPKGKGGIVATTTTTFESEGLEERFRLFDEVFLNGKTVVICMGTSFSDYDLRIWLQKNREKIKEQVEFIFIQHGEESLDGMKVEEFGKEHVLSGFEGRKVTVKTRDLCTKLFENLNSSKKKVFPVLTEEEKNAWTKKVSHWVEKQDPFMVQLFLIDLLSYIQNSRIGLLAGRNINELFALKQQVCALCQALQSTGNKNEEFEKYVEAVQEASAKLEKVIEEVRSKMLQSLKEDPSLQDIHHLLVSSASTIVSRFVGLKHEKDSNEFPQKIDSIEQELSVLERTLPANKDSLKHFVDFQQTTAQFQFIHGCIKNIKNPDFSYVLGKIEDLEKVTNRLGIFHKKQEKLHRLQMLKGLYKRDENMIQESISFFQKKGMKECEALGYCFLSMVARFKSLDNPAERHTHLAQAKSSIQTAHTVADPIALEVDRSFAYNGSCPLASTYHLDLISNPECMNKKALLKSMDFEKWTPEQIYLFLRTY